MLTKISFNDKKTEVMILKHKKKKLECPFNNKRGRKRPYTFFFFIYEYRTYKQI